MNRIYPVSGVAIVIISSLYSLLILKEKLPAIKWIGVFVGTVAVFLLNLT